MKAYLSILIPLLFVGCSLQPKATFTSNSNLGTFSELIDFDDVELRPTAQIGLIIDNSSSMQDEQEKIATGIEKMINSLKGFNVDIYTISTTALGGMHRINTSGNHGHISFDKVDGKSTFKPITALPFTDNAFFSKPFISVENIVTTDNEGQVRDTVPRSWESLGDTILPWKIDFDFKTLPSATNNGVPFKIHADMTEAEIASVSQKIRQEVSQFGISGSPDNYGACALYRMARDMMPAGKATSFFLISDGNDKSNSAVDTAYRKTFEQASAKGFSYCSESSVVSVEKQKYRKPLRIAENPTDRQNQLNTLLQNGGENTLDNIQISYDKNRIKAIYVEYSGLQLNDGSAVSINNAKVIYRNCTLLAGLCDLPDFDTDKPSYELNATEIAAIMAIENAKTTLSKAARIDSARVIKVWNDTTSTPHFAYHTEDRKVTAFTHTDSKKVTTHYSNIFDYYEKINSSTSKTMNSMSSVVAHWRYNDNSGYLKRYPKTTKFINEDLKTLLANKNSDFSNALGDMFIEQAQAKFPAFSFSAIVHDEVENEGKNCGDGEIENGTVYSTIAEKVEKLENESIGKVNSICESSYDQYIEDIKNSFIVKNASLSYNVKLPFEKSKLSKLKIVRPNGEKITLKITRNIAGLDDYDAAVVGETVTLNKESIKKMMGIETIDAEAFKGHQMDVTFSSIK